MLQRKILSLSNISQKNYFRKKKINYCYGFMPGDFQVICGSMVSKNCQLPASTETPVQLHQHFVNFNKCVSFKCIFCWEVKSMVKTVYDLQPWRQFFAPTPWCTPVLTAVPSTFKAITFFERSSTPTRSKASSLMQL